MSKNKTRPLSELYDILIGHIDSRAGYMATFICNQINWLGRENGAISRDEAIILMDDFKSNRPAPSLHQEYYESTWFNKNKHIKSDDPWWNYPWSDDNDNDDNDGDTRREINRTKKRFLEKLRNQAYEREQQVTV